MSLLNEQLTLLKSAITFIPTHGWTHESLVLGAKKTNINIDLIPIIFPQGSKSAYETFVNMINQELLNKKNYLENSTLRTHEKIEECILIRLQLLMPYKKCVQQARVFHKNPKNTTLSIKTLFSIVDTIWFICGDKSMDWNYYTKRGLLAYVYTRVVLHWLQYEKMNDIETIRPYVREKLNAVMKISKIKNKIFSPFSKKK